jgi:hypothetical protein
MLAKENRNEDEGMPLQEQTKCVIVVAEGLPLGPAVNIASVLATMLGHRMKSPIGPESH